MCERQAKKGMKGDCKGQEKGHAMKRLIINSYADNAFKYCISASNQANEAFNHTVTRKFPKNKNFSMSSSDMIHGLHVQFW